MQYPHGYHLYIQPNLGSAEGGTGLVIGADDEGLAMHAFHSKERARVLLERYGAAMDRANVDIVLARIAVALLPERSDEPDAVVPGFMAEMALAAFKSGSDARQDMALIMSTRVRVSICFLAPAEDEGLCLWKAEDGWHAAHFFSRADVASIVRELSGFLSDSLCRQLTDNIAASRLPSASDRAMTRFRGHGAAMLGYVFEAEQRRQAGN